MVRAGFFVTVLLVMLANAPLVWGMEVIKGPQGVDPFAAPEKEGEAVKEAARAAKAWLGLVDAGEYEKSWEQGSYLLRLSMPLEEWQRKLQASRGMMGDLMGRKRNNAQYTETLPGAPDGVYVVFQYSSSFSKKSRGMETVTMQLEEDDVWRVRGYFIR